MKKKTAKSKKLSKPKKKKYFGTLTKVGVTEMEQPALYAQSTYALGCTVYTHAGC